MMGGLSVDHNLLELVTVDPVWEVHNYLVTYLHFNHITRIFSVCHPHTILVVFLTAMTIFHSFSYSSSSHIRMIREARSGIGISRELM